MTKKWMILFSCMFVLLVGCQNDKADSEKETSKGDNAEQESTNDAQDSERTLPDGPLQKTDESDEVQALQEVLATIDYPIEITGTYDDMTTWAITDIQLQKDLQISGIYHDDTKQAIEELLEGKETITVGQGLDQPSEPDTDPETVENPYDVLALVNKNHALPGDYEPEDLVIPDVRFPYEEDVPKKYLRKIAADALEDLIEAGDEDGVDLFAQSGFRSYDRQDSIFTANAEKNGEEHANTYSARPGESEHQTGLVMDVTAEDVGFDLSEEFGETEEGKWVEDHAHEYGFIIRYPEDKEDITQYQYEPWHLRYVGEQAATDIYEENSSLEEYLGTE